MRSLAVPRADVLTDVASKKMVPDSLTICFRYFAAQFNGRVRNTFPAVENVWLNDRLRWARINAARTRPATFRHGRVESNVKIGDYASQEQPRPGLLIDNAC